MQIVTVLKAGGEYTSEHVRKLYCACSLMAELPFEFVCLTDANPSEFAGTLINVVPLKHDWPGWWSKLEIFREDLPIAVRRLYLDLDTIPVADFSAIARVPFDINTIFGLADFYRGGFASGVILWEASSVWSALYTGVKDYFIAHNITSVNWKLHWDQHYIAKAVPSIGQKVGVLQTLLPDWFVSYKVHCQRGVPKGARIVCFHGKPRPWEVLDEWVFDLWREY